MRVFQTAAFDPKRTITPINSGDWNLKILQDYCQIHIIQISRMATSNSYKPKRFQINRSSIAAKTSAVRFSV